MIIRQILSTQFGEFRFVEIEIPDDNVSRLTQDGLLTPWVIGEIQKKLRRRCGWHITLSPTAMRKDTHPWMCMSLDIRRSTVYVSVKSISCDADDGK